MPATKNEARSRPEPLATREEVAEYLRVPLNTMRKWGELQIGPKYIRVGRYARYRWSDVHAWERENEKASTPA